MPHHGDHRLVPHEPQELGDDPHLDGGDPEHGTPRAHRSESDSRLPGEDAGPFQGGRERTGEPLGAPPLPPQPDLVGPSTPPALQPTRAIRKARPRGTAFRNAASRPPCPRISLSPE